MTTTTTSVASGEAAAGLTCRHMGPKTVVEKNITEGIAHFQENGRETEEQAAAGQGRSSGLS